MARQRLVNVDVPRIDTEPFAELCDQPQLDLVLRRPLPPRQRGRCRLRRGGAALPRDYRPPHPDDRQRTGEIVRTAGDRKSTRLNSSHEWISYAVFCLKKKKK